MNKKISVAVLLVLILSVLTCCIWAAHAEDISVSFKQEYAKAGEKLELKLPSDAEGLSYVWYVGDKKVNNDTSAYIPSENDLEKFIKAEVYNGKTKVGETSIFCSKLPVIYINTENSQPVVEKETYLNAELKIQGNSEYNSSNTTLYNGKTEIKGHGNATWTRFDKKAFKLKLDKKTALFGLSKNKHWLLLANYIDASRMRNAASSEIASILGAENLDCLFVDVVFNGECLGNYQLYEQAKIADGRIEIFNWEDAAGDIADEIADKEGLSKADKNALGDYLETNLSWMTSGKVTFGGKTYTISDYYALPSSANGGFHMEVDTYFDEISEFMTDRNVPVMFKNPEMLNTNSTAFSQIKNYIQKFENAIVTADHHATYAGEKYSYLDLCDGDSVAAYFLANEILISEAGFKSTYFYKDIDGPIMFGPVWDFDWSADSAAPFGVNNATEWAMKSRFWFPNMINDPYIAVKIRQLYLDHADELRAFYAEGGTVDKWVDYIRESAENDYSIWPYSRTFDEDVEVFKAWLEKRLNWMDAQLASDKTAVASLGGNVSNNFTVSVADTMQGADGEFIAYENKAATFKADVNVLSGNYASANFYINGKFYKNVKINNGKASLEFDKKLLTEKVNDKNVITVWLLDAKGNLSKMQFCTLELISADRKLVKATFNDGENTYTYTVLSGDKVYLADLQSAHTDKLFNGWKNRGMVYKKGSFYTMKEDSVFVSSFEACKNGSAHSWSFDTEKYVYVCTVCGKTREDDHRYVDMAYCSFNQSSRYGTRYTGKEAGPTITVSYRGRLLTEGKEYTIEYKNNINAGFATYTIKGVKAEGFSGVAVMTYRIRPRQITKAKLKVSPTKYVYTGEAVTPSLTLTYGGVALKEGVDYILAYSDNVNVGTAKVTIKGIGNFELEREATFEIIPVSSVSSFKATGVAYNSVKLTWKSTASANGYIIYSSAAKDGTYKKLAEVKGNKTEYTDKTAVLGKTGYYKIAAYRTIDGENVTGTVSSAVSAVTKLGKVKTVSAKSQSGNAVKLTFSKVSGATAYSVYRATSKSGTYKKIGETATTSYTDKTAKLGTQYYYKIKAYTKVNSKTFSADFSSVVSGKVVPATVKISSATKASNGAVTVKWGKATGATKYAIYRATSKNGTYKKLGTASSASYTDKTAKASTTYYYKVRAYTVVGGKTVNGAFSAVVSK